MKLNTYINHGHMYQHKGVCNLEDTVDALLLQYHNIGAGGVSCLRATEARHPTHKRAEQRLYRMMRKLGVLPD